ncbi:MAG: molybdopterin molybdotransferase MoeA [Sulfitobacter sp.]
MNVILSRGSVCDVVGRNNISFDDALSLAKTYAPRRPEKEELLLSQSKGRILSGPLIARHSVPPFANAAMDGYALAREDLEKAPAGLPLGPVILAGAAPQKLPSGTACPITTGAPMPLGADIVIEQERCNVRSGQMFLNAPPSGKPHVRHAGEDVEKGQELASIGTIMKPRLAALASATGLDRIEALKPLRIALISTGNEIVDWGQPLSPGQIHDSTRMFLTSELQRQNIELIDLGVQPDQTQPVIQALRNAVATADLGLTTGGASVGRADPMRAALNEAGASELFHGVKMRPGKPVGIYQLDNVPIVTLPGNPLAAIVGYYFIVRAMIETALGARIFAASECKAKLSAGFSRRREVIEFVPVTLDQPNDAGVPVATVIARGNSARLSALAKADGIALIDVRGTEIPAGTKVSVLNFGPFESEYRHFPKGSV